MLRFVPPGDGTRNESARHMVHNEQCTGTGRVFCSEPKDLRFEISSHHKFYDPKMTVRRTFRGASVDSLRNTFRSSSLFLGEEALNNARKSLTHVAGRQAPNERRSKPLVH